MSVNNSNTTTLKVSDSGWGLYKDVLSDEFSASEWTDIFGSSLSDNIKRLIDGQNLEVSDRWSNIEIRFVNF